MGDDKTFANTEEVSSHGSLTSFYRSGTFSSSASRIPAEKSDQPIGSLPIPSKHHDFLRFLAVCQTRRIDFFGITWDRVLDDNSNLLGLGVTAAIHPGLLKLDLTFAFKRLTDRYFGQADKASAEQRRHQLYEALTSEVWVLGNPVVREHENIIRLECICWDLLPEDQEEIVRPVLVFEKAKYGDLAQFKRSSSGLRLSLAQKLKICSDIIRGIAMMHSCGELFLILLLKALSPA